MQLNLFSNIHAKCEHDLTFTFPETHKCEVHHLTFDPKSVAVDEIERTHPWLAKFLRQRKSERCLRPQNSYSSVRTAQHQKRVRRLFLDEKLDLFKASFRLYGIKHQLGGNHLYYFSYFETFDLLFQRLPGCIVKTPICQWLFRSCALGHFSLDDWQSRSF